MFYREFQGEKLSALGFGMMRLPLREDKTIDEEQVTRMAALAIEKGVNYFDTAYPYHGGQSEIVTGKILSAYPRDSYYLATKYPGHQMASSYDPGEVFETQLQKCGVDYFDFYLLHNVYENSIPVYEDPQWGIIAYFAEQKKKGRIRHLGFSCHANPKNMRSFLEFCRDHGYDMEFCQIQLNYLDWTLQDAKEKVEILNEFNVPIWVMEPLRGGKLSDDVKSAFRFLMGVPGVKVVLSGMSAYEQMEENIEIFAEENPLTEEETEAILQKAETLKNAVPCTACRYCCEGCPMGLDIPFMIAAYNDLKTAGGTTPVMQIEALPEEKHPHACIGCGACTSICPQNIDIPTIMQELAKMYDAAPKWADICREREAAAKKLREEKAKQSQE